MLALIYQPCSTCGISQQRHDVVVGKHTCAAKGWGAQRATRACLMAPPPSPPSARSCRGRAEAGPYACSPLLYLQVFHTPFGFLTFDKAPDGTVLSLEWWTNNFYPCLAAICR